MENSDLTTETKAERYGRCFRAIDTLKMIRTIDIKELQDKVIAQLIKEAKHGMD